MSLGLRAMSASYAAMQATGHNIANANVDGYSRQQAELATAKGQYTGAGFFGKGVDVATVTRSHDEFLTRAATIARSLSSMDSSRETRLKELELVFPSGEAGLGNTVNTFLNAMVDLASRPADGATRQVVLAQAEDVSTQFNASADQLDTIQAGVTEDLKTEVASVNGLADSIAKVNNQIAASRGLGQPPNDLLDERDRLISKLSTHVQVTTVSADDGTTAVFIAGGQRLVLGSIASHLKITLDPADPSRSSLALADGNDARAIEQSALGGGAIAGLLRFQNEDLVDARNLIGQMAASVAGAVNNQQVLGLNMQQPMGSVPSKPLFAIGAPLSLPAAGNQRDSNGRYMASVTLTVTDPSALQASNYALRADPNAPGMYELTRLSRPPLVRSVADGDVVDGMRIDIGSPAPAATDRFLLQPVARAASGMARLLDDTRDLAAASPFVATGASANTGTAKVASLNMRVPSPLPGASAQLSFTSDSGDYTWQVTDSSGAVVNSGSGVWQGGETIPKAPADINGFSISLSGVPRNGDVIDVVPTQSQYVASNNGNALALSALRDATLLGQTLDANGVLTGGVAVTDAYATAIADIGVRVQTATSASAISTAVSDQAEAARTETSGVNLDEEAARLIQYQQSYQAAAKVLQIAQSIFQTLLETAGT